MYSIRTHCSGCISRNVNNGTGQILLLLLLVVICGSFLRGEREGGQIE
jgi:hypothetical protein